MATTDTCLTEVPYKKNSVLRFFHDRVEFNGKCIRYDDIATITTTTGGVTVHTFLLIPVGRDFDGLISFKMNDGKTQTFSLRGFSLFGIPIAGNPRKNEELFPPLFDAVSDIVAKNMAERYLNLIQRGNTVEVGGFKINSSEARSITKSAKKEIVINKENYRECRLSDSYRVEVYANSCEIIWNSSIWNNKNDLLIPYIFDALFR